jgi:hypothetical protein
MKFETERITLEVEVPTRIHEALVMTCINPNLFYEIALLKSLKAGVDYYWPIGDPWREIAERQLDQLLAVKRLGLCRP